MTDFKKALDSEMQGASEDLEIREAKGLTGMDLDAPLDLLEARRILIQKHLQSIENRNKHIQELESTCAGRAVKIVELQEAIDEYETRLLELAAKESRTSGGHTMEQCDRLAELRRKT